MYADFILNYHQKLMMIMMMKMRSFQVPVARLVDQHNLSYGKAVVHMTWSSNNKCLPFGSAALVVYLHQ